MTEAAIEEQPQDVTALESALILRSRRAPYCEQREIRPYHDVRHRDRHEPRRGDERRYQNLT